MLEIVLAGGWSMIPLLLCSVVGFSIIAERLWSLRTTAVLPDNIVPRLLTAIHKKALTIQTLEEIGISSPLGRILAAGVEHLAAGKAAVEQAFVDTARYVIHDLEKYLNMLGTIAMIAPMLGLLGTVIGMIQVFSTINAQGIDTSQILSGGIGTALITTAAGLIVAVPCLMGHRYLLRKVEELTYAIEQHLTLFLSQLYPPSEQALPAAPSQDTVGNLR